VTRRLLLSYVSLTAIVLLFLEVPLGVVYLENPASHDLEALAATYRTQQARRSPSMIAPATPWSALTPASRSAPSPM
jgi:hypothetical protein